MKLSKKLVLASLCASMTMGLAFGQTSKTSESTSGLFSTDMSTTFYFFAEKKMNFL